MVTRRVVSVAPSMLSAKSAARHRQWPMMANDWRLKQRPMSASSVTLEKANVFKRMQFALILVVCTAVLAFQSFKCVEKYFDSNTATGDKYEHVSMANFPVMTICPTYPYRLDVLKAYGVETLTDIQFGASWVANDSSVSPGEFYENVTKDVEDFIAGVGFWLEGAINGTTVHQHTAKDVVCGEPLFRAKPYYFNGDCFDIPSPKCYRDAGILEMVFDFTDKTDIFIHHSGQFLSPNSRSRVDVDVGRFVKIAVAHEIVQMLDFGGKCLNSYGEDVDYDTCMYHRLDELMMAELNCTVPWLLDKTRICTDSDKSQRAFAIYQENRRNQKDVCSKSCRFTNMYFGPPVTGMQNDELSHHARAVFYFKRDVKMTSEYFLYSGLSMVAEIGGYVGLLLGFSLFKLASVINWLVDSYVLDSDLDKHAGQKSGQQPIWTTPAPTKYTK